MRTYDIVDAEGRLVAFEISNGEYGLGRRATCRVVEGIPGVRVLRRPGLLSGDTFSEFELDGTLFEIHEDWGDSDRYWIGAQGAVPAEAVATVREAFRRARVTWRSPSPYVRPVLLVVFAAAVLIRTDGGPSRTWLTVGLLTVAGVLAAYDSIAGRRAAARDAADE